MYRHYMLAIDDFNYYPSVVFHSIVKDGWGQIYSKDSHGWLNLEDIKIT